MSVTASVFSHFNTIKDPRVKGRVSHQLQDIFFITLCAVISGAENWAMIETFGKAKEDWLTEHLKLKNGIPSHDTFGDVFAAIDTEHFAQCFSQWVADLSTLSDGEVIAVDGKTLRRSLDKASNKAAIHLVSAWAEGNRLVLGQEAVSEKSNEITAIPKLLGRLDITGAVVTIDAMGCQKTIAKQIVDQGGDYVLSLKGNQGTLHDDVRTYFEETQEELLEVVDIDADHGRIETRTVQVGGDMDWLRQRHPEWVGLNRILAVTANREFKGDESREKEQETRYFISSLKEDDPERFGRIVRAHWSIENNLHWVLDVAFDEDRNRARQGNSAANLGIIRHMALNLIKQETSSKGGVKTRRAKAGWDNQYLFKVLGVI